MKHTFSFSLRISTLILFGWIASCIPVFAQEELIHIGSQRELFVDHHLLDELNGEASLQLHHPKDEEIVMVHDEPWEGNTCAYHTIFQDDGMYRMYYRGSDSRSERPEYTCYAESQDGIHWEKPKLGLVEFEGSKQNNIILEGLGTHNFAPFKDPNPNASPESAYKALARGTGEESSTLFAFQSEDGIHWGLTSNEPVITEGAMDSQNLAFWDPIRKEYRCYFRDFREGVRDIKTCVSKNFLDWSEPEWLEYPNVPTEHLYTNQILPYPRAPHLFVGFPSRYLRERESMVEPLLMTSRDGITFQRWEEALIRPGRNQTRWLNRSNYAWWGLVETRSNLPGNPWEYSIYTNEHYYQDGPVKIRRHTYRPDGFVSIHAGFDGGEVITKPLIFDGSFLSINYSTSVAGSILIEFQDHQSEPIPGYTLSDCHMMYGDSLDHQVQWDGSTDVSNLSGKAIRIRFQLKDADLFSIQYGSKSEQ